MTHQNVVKHVRQLKWSPIPVSIKEIPQKGFLAPPTNKVAIIIFALPLCLI